jgi:hypothetical protein
MTACTTKAVLQGLDDDLVDALAPFPVFFTQELAEGVVRATNRDGTRNLDSI